MTCPFCIAAGFVLGAATAAVVNGLWGLWCFQSVPIPERELKAINGGKSNG